MVQAMINLEEHQDRVLTIVKGKYGLKNKSEAINLIIEKFENEVLEPNLRLEYKQELLKVDKGKSKKFSSIAGLRREIEDV